MLAQHFRANVDAILDSRGWSRTDLANEMQVGKQYINSYLNGHRTPGLEIVEKFAKALHVDPCALLLSPAKQNS